MQWNQYHDEELGVIVNVCPNCEAEWVDEEAVYFDPDLGEVVCLDCAPDVEQ